MKALLLVLPFVLYLPVQAQTQVGDLSGTVFSAADNQPLAGATVAIAALELSVTTNSQGNYIFAGVPIGTYDVAASATDHITQVQTAVVNAGQVTTINFNLVPFGGVTGSVVDAITEGIISGAQVTIIGTDPLLQTTTDSEGGFNFPVVPTGSYTVMAALEGYENQILNANVAAGEITFLTFRLLPFQNGQLAGSVYDAASETPLSGALITIEGTDPLLQTLTDIDGEYSFADVPEGTYDVTASLSGYQSQTQSDIDVPAGEFVFADFFLDPLPVSITVLQPNGGETWSTGTVESIQWTSANLPPQTVTIYLVSGEFSSTVVEGIENTGQYDWFIPEDLTPSDFYRIQIVADESEVFDNSDDDFTILGPPVTVVSPNGGEVWTKGTTEEIQWRSDDILVEDAITIELIQNESVSQLIASGIENSGAFTWLIPEDLPAGLNYRIRVSSTDQPALFDESDENFSIRDQPRPIIAVDPDSYDFGSVLIGSEVTQVFSIDNEGDATLIGSVALGGADQDEFELTEGGGAFSIEPGGSEQVTVTFSPETSGIKSAQLEITHNAPDQDNPLDVALSGTALVPITVVRPDGGEVWVAGTDEEIRWIRSGVTGAVRIDLLLDGQIERTITPNTENTGTFTWSIPEDLASGSSYRVRISSVDNEEFSDESNDDFSIAEPSRSLIVVDPDAYDFGEVPVGSEAVRVFTISNIGEANLNGSVALGGTDPDQFELTGGGDFSIEPGDSVQVTVTFRPATPGARSAALELTHDAANQESPLLIPLRGSARSSITVVQPNGGETWTAGTLEEIRWTTEGLTGSVRVDLLLDNEVLLTIAPDTNDTGTLDWSIPGDLAGDISYRIRVSSVDDPEISDESDDDFTILAEPVPLLSVEPASHDFEEVPVGAEATRVFTVSNPGQAILDVSVMLDGVAEDGFELTGGGDFSVDPGDSLLVTVTFRPVTPGEHSASLEITHNASNQTSPLQISLAGTGQASVVLLSPVGGEVWIAGTEQEIRWTSQGLGGTVVIDLLRGEQVDRTITPGTDNSGTFLWQIPLDLEPAEDLAIRISSLDNPGVFDQSEGVFSIRALNITVQPDEREPGSTDFTVTVSTSEGFQVTEQTLHFRRGGERTFQQVAMTAEQGQLRGTIPPAFVTERGIDYYVRLSDGATVVTFPFSDPESRPLHERVRLESRTSDPPFAARRYRMISVPLELDERGIEATLVDDYGAYDRRNWRLLRWNASNDAYAEPPQLAQAFTPGVAFWLITATGSTFDVGAALSVDASVPAQVVLQPGWNQVGTPYAFAVNWDEVLAWNATRLGRDLTSVVGPPVAYDGQELRYDSLTSVLEPWQGYFVYNATGEALSLEIPALEADLAASKTSPPVLASAAYLLQLRAGVAGTLLRDTQNWIGLVESGSPELKLVEAPGIGPRVRLSLLEDELRYAALFEASNPEGHRWDLEIALEEEPPGRPERVRVQLEAVGVQPDGFDLYVLDTDLGQAVPVQEGTFELDLEEGHATRHVRIVLGTAEFAERHREGIPLEPVSDALTQNYPNPFNGETVIAYQLSRRTRVVIEIYNTLGQRLCRLVDAEEPAGAHRVVWSGMTDAGRPAASGLYLYRLQSDSFTAVKTMHLIR